MFGILVFIFCSPPWIRPEDNTLRLEGIRLAETLEKPLPVASETVGSNISQHRCVVPVTRFGF
jgi:hypothetical protein